MKKKEEMVTNLVNETFALINNVTTNLNNIYSVFLNKVLVNHREIVRLYPKNVNPNFSTKQIIKNYIEFKTNQFPEIEGLSISSKEISKSIYFSDGKPQFIVNPKTDIENAYNLLYAVIWKNGDINKVKHLLGDEYNGATGESDPTDESKAIVFKQFGKFIKSTEKNVPIIDQHVLRAFLVYKLSEINKQIEAERQHKKRPANFSLKEAFSAKTFNTNRHQIVIKDYINWFDKLNINTYKANREVDKTLFTLGKLILVVGKKL